MNKISFEEFKKIDIRVGIIKEAEKVPNTDKLLKLQVEFGLKPSAFQTEDSPNHLAAQDGLGEEREIRQIVSGIAEYYSPDELVGKQFPFVYNLEPRVIRGEESNGMILGVGGEVGFVPLSPVKEVPPGSGVG